jgi:hypothetical protein
MDMQVLPGVYFEYETIIKILYNINVELKQITQKKLITCLKKRRSIKLITGKYVRELVILILGIKPWG